MTAYPDTSIRSSVLVAGPVGACSQAPDESGVAGWEVRPLANEKAIFMRRLVTQWGMRLAAHFDAGRRDEHLDRLIGLPTGFGRWIEFDVRQRGLVWPAFAIAREDLEWLAERRLGISFDQVFVGAGPEDAVADEEARDAGRVSVATATWVDPEERRRRIAHRASEPDTALRWTLKELGQSNGAVTSVSVNYYGAPEFATAGFELSGDLVAEIAARSSRLLIRQRYDSLSTARRRDEQEAALLRALEHGSLTAKDVSELVGLGPDVARRVLGDLAARGMVARSAGHWRLGAAASGR